MPHPLRHGAMIAIAAAGLFGAACKQQDDAKSSGSAAQPAGSAEHGEQTAHVQCHGINDCKGKSGCSTATNECAGQNACKGKGWLETTEAECKTKGGTPKPM